MNAPLNHTAVSEATEVSEDVRKRLICQLKGERKDLPVSALEMSPRNVRTVLTDVTELAELIYTAGAVLNTLVVVALKGKNGKLTGKYGVIAGGRRMRACQKLVAENRMQADFTVPGLIVSEDDVDAVELSVIENHGREGMHPVDQFRAFAKLVEAGRSAEEIAAAHHVTVNTVNRRLRLAKVSPRLIEMCARDEIKPEILAIFTLNDDHATQEMVWDAAPSWMRNHPSELKSRLLGSAVSNTSRLGRFVTADEYVAAGGTVRADLFSDTVYFNDSALLEQTAIKKLNTIAESLKAEGWGWVEQVAEFDYNTNYRFATAPARQREATAEEQAAIDAQYAVVNELREKANALEAEGEGDYAGDDGDSEDDDELMDDDEEPTPEQEARQAEIDEALHGEGGLYAQLRTEGQKLNDMQAVLEIEHDKSQLGVVFGLDYHGKLEIKKNVLRPGQKMGSDGTVTASTATATGAGSGPEEKTKTVHNKALTEALTAHRAAAIQAALTKRPDVALAAVVYEFASRRFYTRYGEGIFQLSMSQTYLKSKAADVEEGPAAVYLHEQEQLWQAVLPKKQGELMAWLLEQPQQELLALLAFTTSIAFNGVQEVESRIPEVDAAMAATDLDMADWWQVTGANYFSKVSKDRILAVVAEAAPEALPRLQGIAKKGDLVAAAELELVGKRWLPELMRRPS